MSRKDKDWAGSTTQVVECLLSKHEILNSNSSTATNIYIINRWIEALIIIIIIATIIIEKTEAK
jgi:hypothetical protein